MILPNKNIILQYSILGSGSIVLKELLKPETVSSLWEKLKDKREIQSFEKFVLTLDFLYSINALEINNGLISIIAKQK
ncbi:MAG TPA: ABC-three component system middle component 6 [Bacteroidia bacterium]